MIAKGQKVHRYTEEECIYLNALTLPEGSKTSVKMQIFADEFNSRFATHNPPIVSPLGLLWKIMNLRGGYKTRERPVGNEKKAEGEISKKAVKTSRKSRHKYTKEQARMLTDCLLQNNLKKFKPRELRKIKRQFNKTFNTKLSVNCISLKFSRLRKLIRKTEAGLREIITSQQSQKKSSKLVSKSYSVLVDGNVVWAGNIRPEIVLEETQTSKISI